MDEANGGNASFYSNNHHGAGTRDSAPFSPSSDLASVDPEPNSPALVPPYWQQHRHYESYASVQSEGSAPIRLIDHTEDSHEQNKAVWARRATIGDYVLITGNLAGVGDYIVWNCKIETLDVSLLLLVTPSC